MDVVSTEDQPDEQAAGQQVVSAVDRNLELLEEKYRVPLILFYFAGLNTREISHRLALSRSAIQGRLRRGKSKLRLLLVEEGIDGSVTGFAGFLIPEFLSNPDLIARTCRRLITTGKATATAVCTNPMVLKTGTKLMICKVALVSAMASLVAIATWLHTPLGESNSGIASTLQLSQEDVAQEESDNSIEISETEVDGFFETIHQHGHSMHDGMLLHIHEAFGQVFDLFGEEEEEIFLDDALED